VVNGRVVLAGAFPEVVKLGDRLRTAQRTVAVAESCTGGLLGAALTSIPGSSDFVRGGIVAYHDDLKALLLGVSRHLLATEGSVSAAVARAMALGTRHRCAADIGLAITGIAGPGGATAGKPVGLIFVAACGPDGEELVRLEGDHGREENRSRAVHTALELCLRQV
jgi:PncC family amidohydrolase